MEPLRVAPIDEVREGKLRRRHGPDPVARVDVLRGVALGAALRDERARVDGRGIPDEHPQLVVLQEQDVVRLVEPPGLDQLLPDGEQHEADVRVGALVDIEVVVRRQRRHPQVDRIGGAQLLERVAIETVEDLLRGRLDVLAHRVDRDREVVVGGQVAADKLEDGLHLLAHGGEDELVAPDRVPAELALVRLDAFRDESAAAIGRPQGRGDLFGVLGLGGAELDIVANLVLHPPQRLDRVPVPVLRRVLEPTEQLLVDRPARLLHHRPEVQRRRQLGEVEHPVDLPMAIMDVDGVLEQRRRLRQRHRICLVQLLLEVGEIRCISGTSRSRHQSAKCSP